MPSNYTSRRSYKPGTTQVDPLHDKWNERATQAKNDRRRYEPTWHLCQSYLAGRQWVGWNNRERRIMALSDHPDWKLREQHTVNVLTSYVWNFLARVMDGDLKPDLTFRREDLESAMFALAANSAWTYSWEEEVDAKKTIRSAALKELCYGTSAMRVVFDTSLGPSMGELPIGPDKQPITNPEEAMAYVAQAAQAGVRVKFQEVREGKNIWEPLGPFQLLPPPGVEYENDFPWLIVERAVSIERIKDWFGKKAAEGMSEDTISAVDMVAEGAGVSDAKGGGSQAGKLKEHVMLRVGYEFPCPDYPEGTVVTFTKDQVLDKADELPYVIGGVRRAGIAFLHYHKIPGRFWSQGVVEPGMGIQRQINRARSQNIESKDRNLGRVYAYRGTITKANEPVGRIQELIEVTPGHEFPHETTSPGPGPWIQAEADISMGDLDRVLGSSDVTRGNPPGGVSAYSALSLLAEQSDRQIGPVVAQVREAIIDLSKYTVFNIRAYWQQNKLISVLGADGLMDAFTFRSAQLPEDVYVQYPEGAPRPHSEAAEVQKAFDLYDRSVAGGRPLPITWLYDSLEAGKVDQIPDLPGDAQQGKAEMENMLLQRGEMIQPAPYDDDMLHIEIHRAAQTRQDLLPGGEEMTQLFEQHIQMHLYMHQIKMMQAAMQGALQPGMMPGMMPGMPGMGAPQGGPEGAAGLGPNFPGGEQTASQRGPLGPVGSPDVANMNGGQ